jgi:hypothetical protein
MLSTFLFLALRHTARANYAKHFASIADFGFYPGGELSVSVSNPDTARLIRVNLAVFARHNYSEWYSQCYFNGTWDQCDSKKAITHLKVNVTSTPVSLNFTVPVKDVYYIVSQHCLAHRTGSYLIEATFVNPGGQHLDWRDLPSLKILKVVIGVFSGLLVMWIGVVFVKRRKFLPIHVYCGLINGFYLCFLIFHLVSLNKAQTTDDSTVFGYLRSAFEFTYDTVLFVTLVFASGGWGLLNVELTISDIVKAVLSVTIFIGASFAQFVFSQELVQAGLMIAEVGAGISIWYLLHANSETAQNRIKAHLLAIRNDGIVPISTPIYQKFLLYQIFLNIAVMAFLSFLMVNVFLSIIRSDGWIIALTNNVFQFVIIVTLMVLFRPRGRTIDEYMQPDGAMDGQTRGEVALDELTGFEVEDAQEGMREWEEGMDLPLQPLVVSSRSQPVGRAERAYAEVGPE